MDKTQINYEALTAGHIKTYRDFTAGLKATPRLEELKKIVIAAFGIFVILIFVSFYNKLLVELILLICCLPLTFKLLKAATDGYNRINFCVANRFDYYADYREFSTGVFSGELQNRPLSSTIKGVLNGSDFIISNLISYKLYGKSTKRIDRTFAAIDLDKPVPNALLIAKKPLFLNPLAYPDFSSDCTSLQLEGDFNDYFSLNLVSGTEQDILYILAPDVMNAFVNYAKEFDIELAGDRLLLYKKGEYSNSDIKILIETLAALCEALNDNLRNYRPSEKALQKSIV